MMNAHILNCVQAVRDWLGYGVFDRNPTIVVEFDGVIHSYKSGWKGVDVIPDEPVPGAIDWLQKHLPLPDALGISDPYTGPIVQIYSPLRSGSRKGVKAMKNWLVLNGLPHQYITDGLLKFPKKRPEHFIPFSDVKWSFPEQNPLHRLEKVELKGRGGRAERTMGRTENRRADGVYEAAAFDVVDHRKSPPNSWAKFLEETLLTHIAENADKGPQGIAPFKVDPDDKQLYAALQDVLIHPHVDMRDVYRIDFNLLKNYNGFELSVYTDRKGYSFNRHTIIIQKDPLSLGDNLSTMLLEKHIGDGIWQSAMRAMATEKQLLLKATRVVCSFTFNHG